MSRPKKDPDIEPTFGCYGAKCCDCCVSGQCKPNFACCAPVPHLVPSASDKAFIPSKVRIDDLYLICHCCCIQNSAYVPATAEDAFGCQDASDCFCVSSDVSALQLPLDKNGYELCLCVSGQTQCTKPKCKCAGNTRIFFNFAKFT